MRPALIIKTGSKLPSLADTAGDYEEWIARGLGLPDVEAVDVTDGTALPPPDALRLAVITGSSAMVSDGDRWIDETAAWLHAATEAGLPLLGICFGHQLLAHALGGMVGDNPRGLEVGTVAITLTPAGRNDPLLAGLPDNFPAQVSHRQSVLRPPPGARILASSAREPIQAFAWAERAWGLQFHPEFDRTIIRHYVEYFRQTLHQQGDDTDQLLATVNASDASATLLGRFARIACEYNEEHHAR